MRHEKNENEAMSLSVTEGLTVRVLPSSDHEFLMTTKEVAHGYETTKYAVLKSLNRHADELIEGKHFVKGVDIMSTPDIQPTSFLFTKRGIVRLGFFIKSERAKLFRDWAEDLVIDSIVKSEGVALSDTIAKKALPAKRKHNRLTQERMVDILADVCLIDNKDLRVSLTNKLMGRE